MKFKYGTRRRALEYEKAIAQWWKENKIFEKSVEMRPETDAYVFYDGPPFANGLPHHGHVLGSIVKDLVGRYWTMKGKRVERRWGWDCHGLPAEKYTENQLGIVDRREIGTTVKLEDYINQCRENVSKISDEWESTIDRIGRWVDFKGAYRTMDKDFMESVWWAFAELYKKGKIYEGKKVLMYDTKFATPVSKNEVTMDNDAYQTVTDPSVFVKFRVKNRKTIAVDIDDVLADLASAIIKYSNDNFNANVTHDDYMDWWGDFWKVDIDEVLRRAKIVMSDPKVYPELQPIIDSQKAIKKIARHYRIVALTSRRAELTETTKSWLKENFPEIEDVVFAGFYDELDDKSQHQTKGDLCIKIDADYLIDDQPKHIQSAANCGLKGVLFGDFRFNRDVEIGENVVRAKTWRDVEKYFESVLGNEKNEKYLLAWTTTPWTLPANMALAVNPKLKYVEVEVDGENLILARDLVEKVLVDEKHQPLDYKIVREMTGKDLVGIEYIPLLPEENGSVSSKKLRKVFLISGKHAFASTQGYYSKLKKNLEKQGYDITIIDHINPAMPNYEENLMALEKYDFNGADVVTHSLGGPTFLSFLERKNIKINTLTMIAPAYPGRNVGSKNRDWIKNSGYVGFSLDYDDIRKKIATQPVIVYSDNDVAGRRENVEDLGRDIGAKMVLEPSKKHFFGGEGEYFEPSYKFPFMKSNGTAHKIYPADFVENEGGTGIVHIAPAYGEDDFALAEKYDIPVVDVLDDEGYYFSTAYDELVKIGVQPTNENGQIECWAANKFIAKCLQEKGVVWKIDYIRHEYPFNPRSGQRIMYRAFPSWFFDVAGQKPLMLEQNENINWFPAHIKNGRFAKNIEAAPDWNLSRDRFWATAMPVWKGDRGSVKVVGSYAELEKLSGVKLDDYHRPWVDEIEFDLPYEKIKNRRIIDAVKKLNLPVGEYVVDGSTPLEIRGLDKANDIDIFVTQKLFDKLKRDENWGLHTFENGDIALTNKIDEMDIEVFCYSKFLDSDDKKNKDKIARADVFDGIAFMNLVDDLEARKRMGREKDIRRIEIIEKYLAKNIETEHFTRIDKVLDCWFESGSMPFAQLHYPFENKEKFEANYPADFIVEYVAQVRAWFYYVHVVNTALASSGAFGEMKDVGIER